MCGPPHLTPQKGNHDAPRLRLCPLPPHQNQRPPLPVARPHRQRLLLPPPESPPWPPPHSRLRTRPQHQRPPPPSQRRDHPPSDRHGALRPRLQPDSPQQSRQNALRPSDRRHPGPPNPNQITILAVTPINATAYPYQPPANPNQTNDFPPRSSPGGLPPRRRVPHHAAPSASRTEFPPSTGR